MKSYGDVNVLVDAEISLPALKPKQVLIKQHAVAIDPYDVKFRAGLKGREKPTPLVAGSSVAGEIVKVGNEVTKFQIGQRVAASPHLRSYAECVAVGQSQVARIPQNVTYQQAAACALGVQTAYQLVYDNMELTETDRVLVHGGAGSVGFAAIQFIRQHKVADIYTTASKLGADFLKDFDEKLHIIDYRNEDFRQKVSQVDKIIDTVGGQTLSNSLTILAPDGKLFSTVSDAADPRVQLFFLKSNGNKLEAVLNQVASEELVVRIAQVAPFNAANLRKFHQIKHVVGKLVLSFEK
ncbi:zinc-binding oxidoreductase [Liquorilactobacillus aquaticus DSM 21051]|uniref:Zinc-binding oxidoreductase n=2 Tax=Liquorilactobacillus aquaticus TaxID=392566 RepID=A0A0R2CTS6_9LACO|nr:zinc-binding oxidoreductase [Liquorilactobacillus aquaticus DSM 21051]